MPCPEHAVIQRPNSHQRGYGGTSWRRARATVLARDPVCTVCGKATSVVADHHPIGRRELLARGVPDPDNASRMRGMCRPCHSIETAINQPGGWNAH